MTTSGWQQRVVGMVGILISFKWSYALNIRIWEQEWVLFLSTLETAPQTELNFWLSPSAKQRRNPCPAPPPPPPPLSFRVWVSAMIGLYKMPLSYFPIRLKGNSKCICGNSLSPLVAQNKDFSPASQTSLTGLRLRLRGRLLRLEGNQNFYYALHRKYSRLCWFCDKRKPLL